MRRRIALAVICAASCGLYLGVTFAQIGRVSFPLDDAWIHLTFARNLAQRGEFAFVPGQLSAGSTSPLWTILLAPGFLLPFGPVAWDYALGVLLLFGTALLAGRTTQRLFPDSPLLPFVASLATVLEWHLNWAAYSGMETLLAIALCLLVLERTFANSPPWLIGIIGGLAIVTRPESVIVFGLAGLYCLVRPRALNPQRLKSAIRVGLALAAGCVLPLIPYLAFNWVAGGSVLPNTFFAKQAEYADLIAQDAFPVRLANLITVTFIGAQALLVPGFLFSLWLIWRGRKWDAALLAAWWLGLLAVYALRLPVTYQHGRYEMPVIPALLLLGLWGSTELIRRLPSGAIQRVIARVGIVAFALLQLLFWLRGATALATDSAVIDCIDVQTALWLASHSEAKDVIALHDVGAAGYYLNDRPLLDLAGLITPDVIPFVRDEARLKQYIIAHHAAFLVTSEAWHPKLILDPDFSRLFEGTCEQVIQEGGYSIGVYRVAYH